MPPLIDLTGKTFGRLTVVERAENGASGQPKWLCRCECGSESVVFGNALRDGVTKSCGCLNKEVITDHGMTGSPEFIVWQMMRQRCNNPNASGFEYYGGRGISVCDRWEESFRAFYEDVGPRPSGDHTLDRIDNDGDYTPENCRWSTPKQQGADKRNNHMLTYQNTTLHLSEWARRTGIHKSTLSNRIKRGWSVEKALTEPIIG